MHAHLKCKCVSEHISLQLAELQLLGSICSLSWPVCITTEIVSHASVDAFSPTVRCNKS